VLADAAMLNDGASEAKVMVVAPTARVTPDLCSSKVSMYRTDSELTPLMYLPCSERPVSLIKDTFLALSAFIIRTTL
jgi:hypothetical protein